MRAWRILALLALIAFWTQSLVHLPATATVLAQAAVSSQAATPAQNNALTPSSPTEQNAAPASLQGPVQPIPFSHKQHAGTMKLPCEFCHVSSRSGETVAIPQATFCMQCHQTMGTSDPGVQKLAQYAKSNTSIPWVRVYELPSFVSFSHKTHLAHGIACQQCHGPVADRVQLAKETDISMAGCVNCHREKKASIECDTCHMLEQ